MATTLYLHAALNTQSGTFPTTKQTTQTMLTQFDAYTVNRTMDTTIGTTQTDLSRASTTGSGAHYVSRFISPPLNQSGIAANTWNWGFGHICSTGFITFPVDSNSKAHLCAYVWRPSTGTKIGTIFDGASTSSGTASSSTTEKTCYVTFTGSAVTGAQVGDVIIVEAMVASNVGSSYTFHFCFDGATAISSNNVANTNAAAALTTPEDITFGSIGGPGPAIDCTSTAKVVTNKFIVKG